MTTKDEVEKLKAGWVDDPCLDIEETEGFEDVREELLQFRKEFEAESLARREEQIARRARIVAVDTGVSNQGAAKAISTYEEIEREVDLKKALVRATLLLAAQTQRVADALEARNTADEAESNQDFMTRLYKVS
jgi:hypothetical protein